MAETTKHPAKLGRLARCWRGMSSALRIYLVPLGSWWCRSVDHLASNDRRAAGLVIVLPGIEGRSTLNLDIARGLVDGGVPCSVELHDWTTGRLFYSLYHLRSTTWQARQAVRLAKRITDYQSEFPGRPVVLVGHSGGAAMSLLTLPLLEDRKITGAVMLAAAVSPRYDTTAARQYVERGIWSFHSPLDWLQLGLGTLAAGTFDGKHTFSAGMVGFRDAGPRDTGPRDTGPRDTGPRDTGPRDTGSGDARPATDDIAPFHQIRYRFTMLGSWNFGGHHGWANRLFAAEWLAPIVLEACQAARP